MSIYYNAETRTNPGTVLRGIEIVAEDDHFYKFDLQRAKASKQAVIDYDCTGGVSWVEDGVLYKAMSTGSWDCKPVAPGTMLLDDGINWATAYFATEKDAKLFEAAGETRHDPIRYSEEYDVYSIHYHKFN